VGNEVGRGGCGAGEDVAGSGGGEGTPAGGEKQCGGEREKSGEGVVGWRRSKAWVWVRDGGHARHLGQRRTGGGGSGIERPVRVRVGVE